MSLIFEKVKERYGHWVDMHLVFSDKIPSEVLENFMQLEDIFYEINPEDRPLARQMIEYGRFHYYNDKERKFPLEHFTFEDKARLMMKKYPQSYAKWIVEKARWIYQKPGKKTNLNILEWLEENKPYNDEQGDALAIARRMMDADDGIKEPAKVNGFKRL